MNAVDGHDVRSELDEMFRRRETDVGPTLTLPSTTRVRVRVRRAVATAATGVAIVAVVGVSVAALSGLIGVAQRPAPGSNLASGSELTSGTIGGVPWTMSAGIVDGMMCTEIEIGGEVGGGCWPDIADAPHAQLESGVYTLGPEDGPDWRRFSFVVAIVPDAVASVVVESDAGVARSVELADAPEVWGPVRVAVVPIEEGTSTLLSSDVEVRYVGHDGDSPYPAERIGLAEALDIATTPTVPGYVSHEISTLGAGQDARTLLAWKEGPTPKFVMWLRHVDRTLVMAATADGVERAPIISIHPRCGDSSGVVWGTVPSNVAAIEVGVIDPDRITAVQGPAQLGDVRFVLGEFVEPYPDGAPVTYLDDTGAPIRTDWPAGPQPAARVLGCLD
jgi:hypothetical protein